MFSSKLVIFQCFLIVTISLLVIEARPASNNELQQADQVFEVLELSQEGLSHDSSFVKEAPVGKRSAIYMRPCFFKICPLGAMATKSENN